MYEQNTSTNPILIKIHSRLWFNLFSNKKFIILYILHKEFLKYNAMKFEHSCLMVIWSQSCQGIVALKLFFTVCKEFYLDKIKQNKTPCCM